EQLGSGGMSVVWRGFDDLLGRPVAVKVLAAPIAADPAFRAAIYREARSAARLSHPHITHVYDYGEAELPDGETVSYVVMELLEGRTLHQRLAEAPLAWPEAVRIAGQVADALAAAHRRGIVHRDIAPPNVVLTPTGAKVLDFGIAALAGGRGDPDGGGLLGTPAYVAPERLADAPAAPAADVYALGALLYESLTGEPPFAASTWDELAEAYRGDAPVRPLLVPGLPPEVAEVCARCLSRDPALRPGSAEVARILAAVSQLPPAQRPAAEPAGTPTDPAAIQAEPTARAEPATPRPGFGAGSGTGDPAATTTTSTGSSRHAVTVRLDRPLPPRRWHWYLVAGLAVVATVALTLLAIKGWSHPAVPPVPAGMSPAPVGDGASPTIRVPAPGPAGNGHARISPSAHPSPPARTSASRSPVASATQPTALSIVIDMQNQIANGQKQGQITSDAYADLQNMLANLKSDLISNAAQVDVAGRAQNILTKVNDREREGSLQTTLADSLRTSLRSLGAG
ncbi:MAG: protein kinase, partial [Micromonosporaceae bacterium]|nr:protein kinase [Micromonosporaceae bacterium]